MDATEPTIFHFVSVPTTFNSVLPSNFDRYTDLLSTDEASIIDPTSFSLCALEEKIGYQFRDKTLLGRAMTHSSANVTKCPSQDGENLEILGDANLGNF